MIGRCHQRRRAVEFRKFLDAIEAEVPAGLDVRLIADNYATHKTALIRNWFAKRPRFHMHFTPTSASWLNLVERWFGLLTEKQLRRGVHQSSAELETAIYRCLDVTNEDPASQRQVPAVDLLSGPRPPTKSWPTSPAVADVLPAFRWPRYRTLVLQRRFLNTAPCPPMPVPTALTWNIQGPSLPHTGPPLESAHTPSVFADNQAWPQSCQARGPGGVAP